jgi:hypothetical protein
MDTGACSFQIETKSFTLGADCRFVAPQARNNASQYDTGRLRTTGASIATARNHISSEICASTFFVMRVNWATSSLPDFLPSLRGTTLETDQGRAQ